MSYHQTVFEGLGTRGGRENRETLKPETGFWEIMKLLDGYFKKDRDNERLKKETVLHGKMGRGGEGVRIFG